MNGQPSENSETQIDSRENQQQQEQIDRAASNRLNTKIDGLDKNKQQDPTKENIRDDADNKTGSPSINNESDAQFRNLISSSQRTNAEFAGAISDNRDDNKTIDPNSIIMGDTEAYGAKNQDGTNTYSLGGRSVHLERDDKHKTVLEWDPQKGHSGTIHTHPDGHQPSSADISSMVNDGEKRCIVLADKSSVKNGNPNDIHYKAYMLERTPQKPSYANLQDIETQLEAGQSVSDVCHGYNINIYETDIISKNSKNRNYRQL